MKDRKPIQIHFKTKKTTSCLVKMKSQCMKGGWGQSVQMVTYGISDITEELARDALWRKRIFRD